ncbi:DUF5011 domain-containing protein [Bacillus sp. HMF5848]|uniref:S-layer homology domain-containing protein n=1 Tax=Bacillus sp. HMF5848 TaxID=2495421 RepID=UPI000F78FC40|nr:S-layer homology domain-containing protein [Bacillus sp. HMF5848]RSK28702.1 DUF5011 domain-containing protein [Bacillus sp. HMF5848]
MTRTSKVYRRYMASAVTATIVASSLTPLSAVQAAEGSQTLLDVNEASFGYNEIMYMLANGIVTGYDDGTYKPNNSISREHAAVILSRAFNLQPPSELNSFIDIPANYLYAKEIAAVKEFGIFRGTDAGEFLPKESLTREQMATILVRAFNLQANDTSVNLSDLQAVSPSHLENVKILYQNGITTGKDDGTYAPHDPVTRAQMAVFLYRVIGEQISTVEAVANGVVTVDGVAYTVVESLQPLFTEGNTAALQGANIVFEEEESVITSISQLTINNSGNFPTLGQKEFEGNLVFDGGGVELPGNVVVNGDFITINNLTVTGDLTISEQVKHDFLGQNVTVVGKTTVNGGDSNTVVFEESTLNNTEVNKKDVRVELKKSKINSMTVQTTAIIDSDTTIPVLKLTGAIDKIELNADIDELEVASENEVKLNGTGKIKKLSISGNKPVVIESVGSIEELVVENVDVKITLPKGTVVKKVTLPEGKKLEDVIENPEDIEVKPDPITTPPSSGGSDRGDRTPPVITLTGEEIIELVVGETYTEPGVTVTDNKDKNVEAVITGEVNTSEVGVYTITYTATDKKDNTATKTRTVLVKPTVPTVTVLGQTVTVNAIQGLEVVLYSEDGTEVARKTADSTTVTFENVDYGAGYYVKQLKADDTYDLSAQSVAFDVIEWTLAKMTEHITSLETLVITTDLVSDTAALNDAKNRYAVASALIDTVQGDAAAIKELKAKLSTLSAMITASDDVATLNAAVAGDIIDSEKVAEAKVALKEANLSVANLQDGAKKQQLEAYVATAQQKIMKAEGELYLVKKLSSVLDQIDSTLAEDLTDADDIESLQSLEDEATRLLALLSSSAKKTELEDRFAVQQQQIANAVDVFAKIPKVESIQLSGVPFSEIDNGYVTLLPSDTVIDMIEFKGLTVDTKYKLVGFTAKDGTRNLLSLVEEDKRGGRMDQGDGQISLRELIPAEVLTIIGEDDLKASMLADFAPLAVTLELTNANDKSIPTTTYTLKVEVGGSTASVVETKVAEFESAALTSLDEVEQALKAEETARKYVELLPTAERQAYIDRIDAKAAIVEVALNVYIWEADVMNNNLIADQTLLTSLLADYDSIKLSVDNLEDDGLQSTLRTALDDAYKFVEASESVIDFQAAYDDLSTPALQQAAYIQYEMTENIIEALPDGEKKEDILQTFTLEVEVYAALLNARAVTAVRSYEAITEDTLSEADDAKAAAEAVVQYLEDLYNSQYIVLSERISTKTDEINAIKLVIELEALTIETEDDARAAMDQVTLARVAVSKVQNEDVKQDLTVRIDDIDAKIDSLLDPVEQTKRLLSQLKTVVEGPLNTADLLATAEELASAVQTKLDLVDDTAPEKQELIDELAEYNAKIQQAKTLYNVTVQVSNLEADVAIDLVKNPAKLAELEGLYDSVYSSVVDLGNDSLTNRLQQVKYILDASTGIVAAYENILNPSVAAEFINEAESNAQLVQNADKRNELNSYVTKASEEITIVDTILSLQSFVIDTDLVSQPTDLAMATNDYQTVILQLPKLTQTDVKTQLKALLMDINSVITSSKIVANAYNTSLNLTEENVEEATSLHESALASVNDLALIYPTKAAELDAYVKIAQSNIDSFLGVLPTPSVTGFTLGDSAFTVAGTTVTGDVSYDEIIKFMHLTVDEAANYEIVNVFDSNGTDWIAKLGLEASGSLVEGENELNLLELVGLGSLSGVRAELISKITDTLDIRVKISNKYDDSKSEVYTIKIQFVGEQAPPIDEFALLSLKELYNLLTPEGKAAFKQAAESVNDLTTDDWNEILGETGVTLDAKLAEANLDVTSTDIMTDAAAILLSTNAAELDESIAQFRQAYASSFFALAGADVTLDEWLEFAFAVEYEILTNRYNEALEILTSPNRTNESYIEFVRDVKNDLVSENEDYKRLNDIVTNELGIALEDVFAVKDRLVAKLEADNVQSLRSALLDAGQVYVAMLTIQSAYFNLSAEGQELVVDTLYTVESFTDQDWTDILGEDTKARIDAATGNQTAAMLEDLFTIMFNIDTYELPKLITDFRTAYKEEFDALFGPDVTVDMMLRFAAAFEQELMSDYDTLLAFATDPSYTVDDYVTYVRSVKNNVLAKYPEYQLLNEQIRDGLGMSLDELVFSGQTFIQKLADNGIDTNALIRELAFAFIGTDIIIDDGLVIDMVMYLYDFLSDEGKAAYKLAVEQLNNVSADQWASALGDVGQALDEKLTAAGFSTTSQDIMEDLLTVLLSDDVATLEANVEQFRATYADEFDAIFGADLTVEKLLELFFTIEYEMVTNNWQEALQLLTDSNSTNEQYAAFIQKVKNDVLAQYPDYQAIDEVFTRELGISIEALFVVKDNVLELIEENIESPLRTAMIDAAQLYIAMSRISNLYYSLEPEGQAAYENLVLNVQSFTDEEWTAILGDVKTTVDAKIDGNFTDIVADLVSILLSVDDVQVIEDIKQFRANYADEFDAIFGADVTVDHLIRFVVAVEARLLGDPYSGLALLGEEARQITEYRQFIVDVVNDVKAEDSRNAIVVDAVKQELGMPIETFIDVLIAFDQMLLSKGSNVKEVMQYFALAALESNSIDLSQLDIEEVNVQSMSYNVDDNTLQVVGSFADADIDLTKLVFSVESTEYDLLTTTSAVTVDGDTITIQLTDEDATSFETLIAGEDYVLIAEAGFLENEYVESTRFEE